ncbi:cytochrome P450 [Mycena epipterygia]|nr:cytochrome P450 [Mycena epipterygia]
MPVIREMQRITMGTSVLRRNMGEEVVVGDKVIPKGDFLIYFFVDVHANPDIYPEPSKFDPRRFDAGREEDKRALIAFLGWGAGWHMCAGMRIAKLEVKLIMALFFLTFEFEVVDSTGEFPKSLTRSNFNEFKKVRKAFSSGQHRHDICSPVGDDPCYIKFKR